jgi:hypothetical protein
MSAAALPPPPGASNPDLSSLASTARGWEAGPQSAASPALSPSPASTLNGVGIANGRTPKLATGSNNVVAPEPPEPYESGSMQPLKAPSMAGPTAIPVAAVRTAADSLDAAASSSYGAVPGRGTRDTRDNRDKKKGLVLLAVVGAALTAVAVAVVIMVTRDKGAAGQAAPPAAPQAAAIEQATGFDLYVVPAGVAQWRLDGDARTDRLPSRIRGISPGTHTVQIDAPPGFLSQTHKVEIVAGKAERVDIKLEAMQGITGVFDSTPAGAAVSLIVDGKKEELGPAPAKAPLDPHHTYQVLFEKPGYVSINRPVVFTGAGEEKVAVTLEKSSVAGEPAKPEAPKPEAPKPEAPKPEVKPEAPKPATPKPEAPKPAAPKPETPKVATTPKPEAPKPEAPKPEAAKAGGTGTLALGSKPSCEVYVDGAKTDKFTPVRDMSLPVGKHRITLVNNEFGIKESFVVEISADKPAKLIKDFSDRLPK